MIDILMATYQGAPYLETQINSILNQTYQDWHLWVGDDGSTDDTKNIVLSFQDPRITLLPGNERFGVIGNFSRLMSCGTAPYIMFSDQDDFWFPNKIEKTLKKMHDLEQQHGAQTPLLVHTDLQVVDGELTPIAPSFWTYAHLDSQRFVTLNRLLAQNVVTGCTMMLNRPLLEMARPIPVDVCMHDWWIALTASTFGSIGIIPEATMAYRQHGKNSVGAKPYGLLSGLKQLKKGVASAKDSLRKRRSIQASQFLERYRTSLNSHSKKMLIQYQDYCTGSPWQKWCAMQQYGFYKSGLLRNLYELLS